MPDPVNALGVGAQPATPSNPLRPFGVTPGWVAHGSLPGATPAPLPAPAPPESTLPAFGSPAPGSAGDIANASSQMTAALSHFHEMMQQKWQQLRAAEEANTAPSDNPLTAQPEAQMSALKQMMEQADTAPTAAGPGGAFATFESALGQVQSGLSSRQGDIPINSLIRQWAVRAPGYSAQLQNLLDSARAAVGQYDGLASAPGAGAEMSKPLQQLGDNIDAWTLNGLLAFQQAVNSQFAME